MATPKGAVEIGGNFYLFKSKTNHTDLIISAHGGFLSDNAGFRVPEGVTIHFYVDHGNVMQDPGFHELSKNLSKAKSVQSVGPGKLCRDYYLSKYQGNHAGEDGKTELESYARIAQSIDTRDWQRNDKLQKVLGNRPGTSIDDVLNDWGTSCLTIRNRNVFVAGVTGKLLGIKLSVAVAAVKKAMPAVKNIHCSFCRSDMRLDDHVSQAVAYA